MMNFNRLSKGLYVFAFMSVMALNGTAAGAGRGVRAAPPPTAVSISPVTLSPATETPPAYFYGTAGIPKGYSRTIIANRFITPSSRILLTVDTTAWPGTDVALPNIKVRSHGNGYFEAMTLDGSIAGQSGVPFNYVVFNNTNFGSSVVGSGSIPSGVYNTGISLGGAVTANSIILLTVDTSATGYDGVLPGLKVNNHGAGFFTITTLNLATAPASGIPFNYLVVNNGDFLSGTGKIPAGVYNTGVSNFALANPSGVFLTVDATTIPGSDVALAGVKVNNHGGSFFTVTSDRLTLAPSSGIPYNYVVFQAPAQWEELGPTGLSANSWSYVVDPSNRLVQYVGSQWGGVWKTVNGGDTWANDWQGQPLIGVTRLAMTVNAPTRLFALSRDGNVWWSDNGANSWNVLTQTVTGLNETYWQGGILAPSGPGFIYVCTQSGLWWHGVPGTTWQSVLIGGTAHPCTDIVINSDGYFAAFSDIGVWANFGGGYIQVKTPIQVPITTTGPLAPNQPIRLAVSQGRIVLNYGCEIYTDNVSSLNSPDSNGTWAYKGRRCYTAQGGYDLAVAISPSNNNHFIVSGNEANLTTDGGTTWSGHLPVGQDDHQVTFWDDQHVYMATDNGPRVSLNGGSTWKEAENNSFITDGPPGKEYYDLGVSLADQFGRVYAGGNAQDSGAVGMIGRNAGFGTCGGEEGLFAVAPRPVNLTRSDGSMWSRFRTYETFEGDPTVLKIGDTEVRGPDFRAPQFPGDEGYSTKPGDYNEEGAYPRPTCSIANTTFPSPTEIIAVSNVATDTVLVGLSDGEVWGAIPGTQGRSFRRLVTVDPPLPVTALYFASDDVAYLSWSSGVLAKITTPFAASWTSSFLTTPAFGHAVVSFASRYGDANEVYAATSSTIYRTQNGGSAWVDVTSPGLKTNLAQGMEIVGLARDLNHPSLYAAVGHPRMWNYYASNSTPPPYSNVWKSTTPVTTTSWLNFSQGLPLGLPITGIGISPDRALYISTDGRAIWWRRDVASNVGISAFTPDVGASQTNVTTTFTLTWTHPITWRDLNTLDLRLRDNHGFAAWVRFTEGVTSTFSLLDASGNVVGTGLAGQNTVLEDATARLDLSHTTFQGTGPTGPSVTIHFALSFKMLAVGRTYATELLATDDFGNSQGPDRVGSWSVVAPYRIFMPVAVSGP